uniref:Uncharacterized protein n=1 Tax=Aegilops tauschii subsp. strangulata TaxID=200361 RepID=A0A453SCF5_AEGTS
KQVSGTASTAIIARYSYKRGPWHPRCLLAFALKFKFSRSQKGRSLNLLDSVVHNEDRTTT